MVKLKDYRKQKKNGKHKGSGIEVHTADEGILTGRDAYDYLHCRGKYKDRRLPRYLQHNNTSKKKGKYKDTRVTYKKPKVYVPDFIEDDFWGTGAQVKRKKQINHERSS